MSNEHLITVGIPERGLHIIPPDETAKKMLAVRSGLKIKEIGPLSQEERLRLTLIRSCPILKKRYPTPQDGQELMKWVDYDRREELLNLAWELSDYITVQWKSISKKDIAIILYGSIARGLVKSKEHLSPSDIDLCVLGVISDSERQMLFDNIQAEREKLQQKILTGCPNQQLSENPVFAGVKIQHVSKFIINRYSTSIQYIQSRATALYDPDGIWQTIERKALELS